jgi:hypothetical protein
LLFGEAFFDQAVDALIRRIAASLRILGSPEGVIGRGLSLLSQLSGFVCHTLCVIGGTLCSFSRSAHGIQVVYRDGVRTSGREKHAAYECR